MQTSTAAKPTVMLTVDDHPLIRSALREVVALMAERIELIEASNPEDGLALLRRRPDIDIVFLDLSFAQHDGLAFVERYRAAAPATPVVIYTMHEDLPTLRQALAHGAAGIVPKTHSAKVLQQAIEMVMDGGVYLPPELARRLAAPEAPAPGALAATMSAQQWRILELLAQGLPNKAIARELGVAASTVKNQLTVVFDKLGVSNRTQAAIAARALLKSKRPGV
ncbi:MAG TPA: response regulator transcription factor [Burkholderiales bacterium]|nr:response regulator transcription factor [Burkholderiales bacterium]